MSSRRERLIQRNEENADREREREEAKRTLRWIGWFSKRVVDGATWLHTGMALAGGYTSPTLAARTRIRVARCRCRWWRRRRGGAGTGGGVTVGYASHSCRGRRTETNRLCMPAAAAAAALLASWPLSGLPCPFLSLPACLSLSFSFPFLFVLSSRTHRRLWPWPWRASRSATEKHFLVPLLPHFPGRSPRATTGHFRLFLSRKIKVLVCYA